ncbi:hypothetical protein SAMN02745823_03827 [Sporobacter termitidis DSM 10068]|uniref:DUF6378 domain-containing protein n=1 Tax=Sporobacter termitidis DSM 10068 TaxID=1123282 RepID=A0A1M5ZJP7_9FIRM|nr:DUF6378 domain-containing protein [Sporobacter termitidis]SHI24368.1 hypothetical protein SAMN02745823_03827 [Sporobacter termitidis DSM 10068]
MNRKQILNEAEKCVCQDREQQYGAPENSFGAIASLWNSYIESYDMKLVSKDGIVCTLDAHDVGIMMCLFKVARIAGGQTKADNYIDLAGYAACAGEIACKGE